MSSRQAKEIIEELDKQGRGHIHLTTHYCAWCGAEVRDPAAGRAHALTCPGQPFSVFARAIDEELTGIRGEEHARLAIQRARQRTEDFITGDGV